MANWRSNRFELAIGALWLCIGLWTIVTAIRLIYLSPVTGTAPLLDQWDYIDPSIYLRDLLGLHNGQHPIVIGRLLFAIDYYFFDCSEWFLHAVVFACLLAETAAFVFLARLGGVRGAAGTFVAAGFSSTMVFTPQLAENLLASFQITFVMTFAAAVGAVCALAAYALKPARWKFALSLAGSTVALVSLANGVIISLLLVGLAFYLRLPRHVALSQLGVALLALPLLLSGHAQMPNGPSFSLDFIVWILHVLGSALGHIPSALWPGVTVLNSHPLASWIGLMLVALAGLFGWTILRKPSRDPVAASLFVLILFVLMTACLAAVGRAGFGIEAAKSGRYVSAGAVLVTALGIGVALQWRLHAQPQVWRTLGAGGAALAILVPLSAPPATAYANLHSSFVFRQSALVVLADSPASQRRMSAVLDDQAWRNSGALRQGRKWHFRDPWSRAIGMPLNAPHVRPCGEAAPVTTLRRNGVLLQMSGTVDGDSSRRARTVVVADQSKRIVGYGRADRDVSDLIGHVAFNPEQRPWNAAVQLESTTAAQRLSIYLASDEAVVCRIATRRSPRPRNARQ
jgi:hypothetical protein